MIILTNFSFDNHCYSNEEKNAHVRQASTVYASHEIFYDNNNNIKHYVQYLLCTLYTCVIDMLYTCIYYIRLIRTFEHLTFLSNASYADCT